jgi:hypothetical protein
LVLLAEPPEEPPLPPELEPLELEPLELEDDDDESGDAVDFVADSDLVSALTPESELAVLSPVSVLVPLAPPGRSDRLSLR